MKAPFLTLAVAITVIVVASSAIAQEIAKTLEKSAKLLTTETYDREAELRINKFTLPTDITASLFADSSQTQNPRAICFDRQGRLYLAEVQRWGTAVQDIRKEHGLLLDDINNTTTADRYRMYERNQQTRPLSFYTEYTDRIVCLEDTNRDGRADRAKVWADGFHEVLDGPGVGLLAGDDNDLYYTNIPHLWHLKDTNNDGKADERTSLQAGFGVRMGIAGHDLHGLVQGPDGKIYWSIGDRGYTVTTREGRHYDRPYTGGVLRCDPDGSNLEEFYTGLRNPQELAFDEYGNLFTCDNKTEAWDTGRLVYLIEGGDSGWNHGHQVLLNFRNQLQLRTPIYSHPGHEELPLNPWMTEGIWDPNDAARPLYALPAIAKISWAPSGLVYNYGVTTMPERYARHFWICNFDGAKGDLEAFSVKGNGAGFALDHQEKFMVGLSNTDVEFGPDGRMYLSGLHNSTREKQDIGSIYALSQTATKPSPLLGETTELLTSDFSSKEQTILGQLLGHPDMRVRQRAQFALARSGVANHFIAATEQTENQLKRLHGIWGLGQLARSDESLLATLIALLTDPDAEVRAQSAKVLADSRTRSAGEALVPLLNDPSSRVRAFAAIGVGKCDIITALPRLLETLSENNNDDVFLRHACVKGMWYLNDREKYLKEAKNESAAIRLGLLLVLRKLNDPRVKYFLNDTEETIRFEAIRAISDLDLYTALPELAAQLMPYATASADIRMPEGPRDWIIQTRIINANFRVGKRENAAHLLEYAAQPALPSILREQALLAIDEWMQPNPVDATNGNYRPLLPESRPDISETVQTKLPAVFPNADGDLLGLATKIARDYHVAEPNGPLKKQILDEKKSLNLRISEPNITDPGK